MKRHDSSRRAFLALSAVAATAAAVEPAQALGFDEPGIKITFPAGGLADNTLRYMQQIGVRWITAGGPNAPTYNERGEVVLRGGDTNTARGPWKEEELRAMTAKAAQWGLKVGNLMLHDFRDVILGRARRDEQIEHVRESIRVAGRVGIPVVEYNWYALRAMEGYYTQTGRGGSELAAHDYERSKNLPVIPEVGEHPADALWERYEYFLKAVMPVAEEAGVYMAVHPNDPPPPMYRGCAQILGSVGGLRRVAEIVPTQYNGITFDTGVTTEMGEDAVEVARWFGTRRQINHIHFRNVLREIPREKYTETFIDVGQADMLAVLRVLKEVGYDRLLHPDHVPVFPGDENREAGWGYAIGFMKGLMKAL